MLVTVIIDLLLCQGRITIPLLLLGRINAGVAAAVGCIIFSTVHAAWDIESSAAVGVTYTDNISLTSESEKESETIVYVTPAIRISRQARRFNLDLNYSIEALFYSNVPDRNELYHQFDTNFGSELIENFFHLDGSLSYTQTTIEPAQTIAFDNLSGTGNRSNVATGAINPYIRRNFNNDYLLLLGTTRSIVDYLDQTDNGVEIPDVDRREDNFSFEKLSGQSDWRWRISYERDIEHEKIDGFDQDIEILNYETSQLDIYYALTSKLEIFASGGRETDLFSDFVSQERPQASFWEAGFNFHSRHSRIEAAAGERSYGRSKRFQFERKSRILTFVLAYDEGISSYADQRLNTRNLYDIESVTNGEIESELDRLIFVRPDTFLEKVSRADFILDISKSLWSISYYQAERNFIGNNEPGQGPEPQQGQELEESIGLNWVWTPGRHSRFRMGVQRIGYDQFSDGRVDYFSSTSLGYARIIDRHLNFLVEYVGRVADTEDNAADYEENRISAGIRYLF